MADKLFRFGPTLLTTTSTTNILKGPVQAAAGTGVAAQDINIVLRHVRVVNRTGTAAYFGLWLSTTGDNTAGKEVIAAAQASAGTFTAATGVLVAANSYFDWYGVLRLEPADYLVGGSITASALTIEGEGTLQVT